ncbi:hypothetical protein Ancab_003332 [Ancistrocladus abbreviatus]
MEVGDNLGVTLIGKGMRLALAKLFKKSRVQSSGSIIKSLDLSNEEVSTRVWDWSVVTMPCTQAAAMAVI